MNRCRWSTPAFLLALLCVGCGLAQTEVEDGATTTTADHEIPGSHAPGDLDPITARRWIDDLQVGRDLDMNGRVPAAAVTDHFAWNDPIRISMEVTDAPAGTLVRVVIHEAVTNRSVWSDQRQVAAGASYLNFGLDAEDLDAGAFSVTVYVGDETPATRRFNIEHKDEAF